MLRLNQTPQSLGEMSMPESILLFTAYLPV